MVAKTKKHLPAQSDATPRIFIPETPRLEKRMRRHGFCFTLTGVKLEPIHPKHPELRIVNDGSKEGKRAVMMARQVAGRLFEREK